MVTRTLSNRQHVQKLQPRILEMYPDKSEWWYDRYEDMIVLIREWRKIYTSDEVSFLLAEELRRSNSPGKRQAIWDFYKFLENSSENPLTMAYS